MRDSGTDGSAVETIVHASELEDLYYMEGFVVTDFPSSSVGKRFTFLIKAYTDFAIDGVASDSSVSMILADKPDKPSIAPTRNTQTSESTVAVNIVIVPGDHGSAITSYNVEIDDGYGGHFMEL